jgi:hypothetical protein
VLTRPAPGGFAPAVVAIDTVDMGCNAIAPSGVIPGRGLWPASPESIAPAQGIWIPDSPPTKSAVADLDFQVSISGTPEIDGDPERRRLVN